MAGTVLHFCLRVAVFRQQIIVFKRYNPSRKRSAMTIGSANETRHLQRGRGHSGVFVCRKMREGVRRRPDGEPCGEVVTSR